MKEMDPSEELEFEHLMQEDENLIIEVESLRATGKKLSKLPLKHPPKHLINKIVYDAKQLQSTRLNKTFGFQNLLGKGLAAAVVLAALSGGYFYFQQPLEPANVQTETTTETVTPWVDRNEVIKWTQQNTATIPGNVNWTNEVQRSYDKLQLVKFYNRGNEVYPGFHLTGTSE